VKILILSDIHANLVALEAVLAEAGEVDEIWNLGDTVGYGPRPGECLDRMVALGAHPMLAGNHDLASTGDLDDRDFNAVARTAARWTGNQLRPDQKTLLRSLPGRTETNSFTLAHGSPRDPVWEYLTDQYAAAANFGCFTTKVCFVGHSHLPLVFRLNPKSSVAEVEGLADQQTVKLDEDRLIINPGSVGQPRDLDPRAAYGLIDTEQQIFTGKRVEYDIEETQRQMAEAHLPDLLIHRLSIGR
jgi:diadenosine tetraphosphatase ApaH/serine/threonine PP2A family protein phosphatase